MIFYAFCPFFEMCIMQISCYYCSWSLGITFRGLFYGGLPIRRVFFIRFFSVVVVCGLNHELVLMMYCAGLFAKTKNKENY